LFQAAGNWVGFPGRADKGFGFGAAELKAEDAEQVKGLGIIGKSGQNLTVSRFCFGELAGLLEFQARFQRLFEVICMAFKPENQASRRFDMVRPGKRRDAESGHLSVVNFFSVPSGSPRRRIRPDGSTLRQLPSATQGPFDGDEEDKRPAWMGRSTTEGHLGRAEQGQDERGKSARESSVAGERRIGDRRG